LHNIPTMENSNNIIDTKLAPWQQETLKLEQRISELISICNGLQDDNRVLHSELQSTVKERDLLLNKNQKALARVSAVLTTVRELEAQA